MKTIPTIIAASLLLASVSASADSYERDAQNTIVTSVTATKADAYALGLNKLQQLQAISPRQLGFELIVNSPDADASTTHLNEGSYVALQERLDASGKIGYVGLVNVNFGYTVNKSSDND